MDDFNEINNVYGSYFNEENAPAKGNCTGC